MSKQYYADYEIEDHSVLRAAFLSGLNAFIEQTFSDEIESFEMKAYTILFLIRPLNNTDPKKLMSYCIIDKKSQMKTAKNALIKILDRFIERYGHLESLGGDLSKFSEFEKFIDKILGDLIRRPDERVRSVF